MHFTDGGNKDQSGKISHAGPYSPGGTEGRFRPTPSAEAHCLSYHTPSFQLAEFQGDEGACTVTLKKGHRKHSPS